MKGCEANQMKLMHGTDSPRSDKLWTSKEYFFMTIVFLCIPVCLGAIVYFLKDSVFDLTTLFYILLSIISGVFLWLGVLDGIWRTCYYSLSDDGIVIRSILKKRVVNWQKMRGYGVFPVFLLNTEMTRRYIVIFLSEKRPRFPKNLTYCSINRKDMILIRSTDERLSEIRKPMEAHVPTL